MNKNYNHNNHYENSPFLQALTTKNQGDYTPIWLMRQAGRYLPEYKATRAKAGGFMDLCKNAELACEVTLQPIQRFDLDAAILFSDILTIPDAMGLELSFEAGEGPRFAKTIRTQQEANQLFVPDPEDELQYVMNAVRTIRQHLPQHLPLIGFAGSPWTLACYMVEGGSMNDYRHIKTLRYQNPEVLHHILNINAQAVNVYLQAQVKAGVQAVMIFDSWGGVLSHQDYEAFSLDYMKIAMKNIDVPVILFTKGGGQWAMKTAQSGCHGIGLDWTVDLAMLRENFIKNGLQTTIQGNLDPMVLMGNEQEIRSHVQVVMNSVKNHPHIFNLGHGINQHTPPESVTILIDEVRKCSLQTRCNN